MPDFGADVLLDYLENRLDSTRRSDVEAALAASSELRGQLAELKRQKQRLSKLGESVLNEPIPDKLLSALDKLKGR